MADYKYDNLDLFLTQAAVYKQLEHYWSACYNNRNYLTAVEKNISEKLLPKLEDLFMEDLMNGGVHDVKYMELNRQKVLSLDRHAYCNYQAAKGGLEKKIGIPVEGEFDLNTEGRKILQMIDDLKYMSVKEFQEKYYIPPVLNGVEKLLDIVDKTTDLSAFLNAAYSEHTIRLDGTFDDRVKIAMAQFLNANPDHFKKNTPKYENQTLYFNGNPIESIDAILIFERKDTSQPFYASSLDFTLWRYEDDDGRKGRSIKIDFTPEQGKELGEKMTHDVFIPKYGAEITSATDKRERNDHNKTER